jgi:hypothetical protein
VTTLDYSPYFPDQDPVDLYLFPRIKLVSKWKNFSNATGIIKNVTEEPKRIAQNGFPVYFRYFGSLYHKFICTMELFRRKCS